MCGTLITTTLQGRYYYYYSHFRDKEMEAQRGEELAQRHTARKGQMRVSNPHSLPPEPALVISPYLASL